MALLVLLRETRRPYRCGAPVPRRGRRAAAVVSPDAPGAAAARQEGLGLPDTNAAAPQMLLAFAGDAPAWGRRRVSRALLYADCSDGADSGGSLTSPSPALAGAGVMAIVFCLLLATVGVSRTATPIHLL